MNCIKIYNTTESTKTVVEWEIFFKRTFCRDFLKILWNIFERLGTLENKLGRWQSRVSSGANDTACTR